MEFCDSVQRNSLKNADALYFSKFVRLFIFQMCKEFYLKVFVFLKKIH